MEDAGDECETVAVVGLAGAREFTRRVDPGFYERQL